MTDAKALTPPGEGGVAEFLARQTALVALIVSAIARTDWLSLPRMLRWRFLLSKDKADLLAREFMRMRCLIQLSHGAIIVPKLLMKLAGWFNRNPSYKIHVASFTGPMPELRPVRFAEGDVRWCHTLDLYEEVFGIPPLTAIWTPGSPALHPWRTGWIVGAVLMALHFITVGLIMGVFFVPMALAALIDGQLTIALVHPFSFETSADWAVALRAFFFFSSLFLWIVASLKLDFFLSRNLPSLPLGHPLHRAFPHCTGMTRRRFRCTALA